MMMSTKQSLTVVCEQNESIGKIWEDAWLHLVIIGIIYGKKKEF